MLEYTYRGCQRDIVRASVIFQVGNYSFGQYIFILRSFMNYASTDLLISHLIARLFALIFAMHEGHMHIIPTVYNLDFHESFGMCCITCYIAI